MIRKRTTILTVLALLGPALATSAGDAESGPPGTEEGARALLEQFREPGPELEALLEKLRPSSEDCAAVFAGDAVQRARDVLPTIPWDPATMAKGLAAKEGHTELLLFSATTEDFKAANEPPEGFPTGYIRYADVFRDGITWYAWKFVKPGEKSGWSMQALTYVNGRWLMFPKAYRMGQP